MEVRDAVNFFDRRVSRSDLVTFLRVDGRLDFGSLAPGSDAAVLRAIRGALDVDGTLDMFMGGWGEA